MMLHRRRMIVTSRRCRLIGRIVVIVSTSPSSLATDRRAETCSKGPSIVSVAAMVAGGDHGLPWWQRAGQQWLRLPMAIKKGGNYGP